MKDDGDSVNRGGSSLYFYSVVSTSYQLPILRKPQSVEKKRRGASLQKKERSKNNYNNIIFCYFVVSIEINTIFTFFYYLYIFLIKKYNK